MAISFLSANMVSQLQIRNPYPCFPPTPMASLPHRIAYHSDTMKQSGGPQSCRRVLVRSLSTPEIQSSGASTLKKGSSVEYNELEHYQILMYPLLTESAIKKIASENTLVFVVDKRANKKNIRDAFEKMFNIKIKKVNTLINHNVSGSSREKSFDSKKAYITLSPEYDAGAVAKKFKII